MRTISISLIYLLVLGSLLIPINGIVDGSVLKPARADYYISPNTNVEIDMEYLVENSDGIVTREEGCYLIRKKVIIEEIDTLTIEPGQVIKFLALARLDIRGTIIADGTPENNITFTQDPEGDWPTYWPSHWMGIFLTETCRSSILDHCLIENGAGTLIVSGTANVQLSNLEIRSYFGGISGTFRDGTVLENITSNSGRGIRIYGGNDIVLKNCVIRSIETFPVDVSDSKIILRNCVLNCSLGMIKLRYANAFLYDTEINSGDITITTDQSSVIVVDEIFLNILDINGDPVYGVHTNITDNNGIVLLDKILPEQSNRWWMEVYSMIYQDLNGDDDCLDIGEASSSSPYHIKIGKDGFIPQERSVMSEESGDIVVRLIPFLNCSTPIGLVSFDEDSNGGNAFVDILDHYNIEDSQDIQVQVSYMEDEANITCVVNGTKLDFIQVNENWYGKADFQIMVKNGTDVWVRSNFFTVTVLSVNDAPQFDETENLPPDNRIITRSMVEDQLFTTSINATDIDGDEITYTSSDMPEWLSLNPETGNIFATPGNEHVGIHIFNLTASDNLKLFDTVQVMIEVQNVNDPPTGAVISLPSGEITFFERSSANLTGTCTDIDMECSPPQDNLTYYWSSNISGFLLNGNLLPLNMLTPGDHLITLVAKDTHGETNETSVKIVILPILEDDHNNGDIWENGLGLIIVIVLVLLIIIIAIVTITLTAVLIRSKASKHSIDHAEKSNASETTGSDPINP